jgi:DNA polymerase-3 subunit epsilon
MLGLFRRRPPAVTGEEAGIDPGTPIDRCRYVVMDSELTGLDLRKDSIVSLGAVAMDGGRILLGSRFHEIVSPATELSAASIVVHGITPGEARSRPTIEAVIDDFLRFCDGAVVVGHFVALDLGFLNKELKRTRGRTFTRPLVDTLSLHEWILDQGGEFSRHLGSAARDKDLFSLAKKFQIPVSAAHDAQMDAFITAQLFQRFLRQLPAHGVRTVKDLLRIGRP